MSYTSLHLAKIPLGRLFGLLSVVLLGFLPLFGCASVSESEVTDVAPALRFDREIVEREPQIYRVSLSAVGDNLMNKPVIDSADREAGSLGDSQYDFTVLYEDMRSIIESHDINFIDVETIIGGDEKGITGYPIFNTPEKNAEDIASFGFNLATTATNHSLDKGFSGIESSSATWAKYDTMVVTGTFTNEEDRNRIRVFEKNGIRFAFLAYTDSLNGIPLPDGKPWAVATVDTDRITQDITRAHELADVIIVAMSWGEENSHTPSSSQRETAQLLADLDTDLVLGFGPHVIQPVEKVAGHDANGADTGHETLVVFSLGNFISNQQLPQANVGGCFTCDFERADNGPVSIKNPTWTPVVNHFSGCVSHRVYQYPHYTETLAASHDILSRQDDPLGYIKKLTTDIIDPTVVTVNV